jgi:Beta-propeller repeat
MYQSIYYLTAARQASIHTFTFWFGRLPALLLVCGWLATPTYAQQGWARAFGGTNGEFGTAVAVDAAGNVYTTGYFSGTADFDPGSGVASLTAVGSGRDVFVSKLDASGNFVWAKAFGGTSTDQGYGISVDAAGNVYTTGSFQGTVDFDPGSGVASLTSVGSDEVFMSKLDASGNYVWAKAFGGIFGDYGYSIAVDAAGNVYTTGFFYGTADFDPGPGVASLSAVGNNIDVFVSKLNASGNYVWAKAFGGTNDEIGYGIALDASGNVYTTGRFTGTTDFDPSSGIANLTSAGGSDVFVSKLNSLGNYVWAKAFGGTSDGDIGYGIALDASDNIYTTGNFQGTVDFDPGVGTANLASAGSFDVFVSKLNTSGNYIWAKAFGSTGIDVGYGIALDAAGNVYTTGGFGATVDFDPGSGVANLTPVGNNDVFVSKLDASGNYVWAKAFGGTNTELGYGIAVDVSGNAYTTGLFLGTVDFDPGPGVLNLTSAGITDVFVSKLNTSGGLAGCALNSSVKAGNWNDPTVWSCGQVPVSADLVSVGHAVSVPTSYTATAGRIRYTTGGRVVFNTPSAKLRVGP